MPVRREPASYDPSEEDENLGRNAQENRIFTIPNLLSMLRIVLIPVIVWLYHVKDAYQLAAGLLLVSGITDVVDGYIARRFHMISDLGKALDPIADKLTQTAVLVCLLPQFPVMWLPLGLLVVKEFITGVWKLHVIHKTGRVDGAQWHGKAATVLLFAMIMLHILWPAIPPAFSRTCIGLSAGMMLVSFALYSHGNYRAMKTK